MYFPTPYREPPTWYWRLSLKWRQRYCRWLVWKWEAVHRFCTNILTRKFLFGALPRIAQFSWTCWRIDRRDGLPRRESLSYLSKYWRDCWNAWYHGLLGGWKMRRVKPGDKVYWEDPDGGLCSGRYTVTAVRGETVSLRRGTHFAEAPEHELTILKPLNGRKP